MQKLRVAFLASNNGTSFRAINHAIIANAINASAVVLISNRRDSTALAYAQANGIPSRHIPTHNREADADREVKDMLLAHGAQIVVLSGYLKKLGPLDTRYFSRKNIECSS